MDDALDEREPGPDDWAGMLAEVEGALDRRTIALALGVKEQELDLIASGYGPSGEAAGRLRTLHAMARRGELSDPGSLLETFRAGSGGGALVPVALLPHVRKLFVLFVLVDAVVVAAIVLFFALRG